MAKQVTNSVHAFNLLESEGVQENERILENGPQKDNADEPKAEIPATEPAQQESPETQSEESVPEPASITQKATRSTRKSMFGSAPLKSEKAVKFLLPMDYYFKLVRLKECSGKTLQELAAQGVMEFIDKYSK